MGAPLSLQPPPAHAGRPEPDAIERQVVKIVASSHLRQSRRRSDLLRWAVDRALRGETDPVKEHEIGIAVFGKRESWDPRVDPIVRVEFNRLRQKLREFYEGEGRVDAILIEFPARGYVPVFRMRDDPDAESAPATPTPAPTVLRRTGSHWPLAIAGVLAAAVPILWLSGSASPRPSVTSIAVLPFLDLSPGHEYEYLSDGFTDQLTNALAMTGGLRVISRTSAFQFKGRNVDIREIGRLLQAGSVVEGSILREGSRIRVIVQLDRTADGTHIWQAQYDRDAKDILGVQDEITQAVADALRLRLTGTPAPDFQPGEQALNEYLQGSYEFEKGTPVSLHEAAAHYENAIGLAPRYALAYAGLATVHFTLAGFAGPEQEELERARSYAEHAISLDPRLPGSHALKGYLKYVLDWDWPGAEAEMKQALALGPSATSQWMYAFALMTRGRFHEADEHNRLAVELDPLNRAMHYDFALILAEEGRAAEATAHLRPFLDRDPRWFAGQLLAGYAELYKRRPASALEHLQRAAALVPGSPMVEPAMAAAYAESGRRGEALDRMRQIESRAPHTPYVRYHLAIVKAFLGDAGGVFHWLGKSVEAHEEQALYMRIDPMLAPYQHDPRMAALEHRVGLIP